MHYSIPALLLSLCSLSSMAQSTFPITRFHATDRPSVRYNNQFLSGFMLSATNDSINGFLQMPYVGRPVWVYVGEKDSTQFMAYASGFRGMEKRPSGYNVEFTRYGIKARVVQRGAICEQHYTYPDTTAEKGFLLDIDHVLNGKVNEDMDVKFIDRKTIRAYKRPYGLEDAPKLYYYAHFSHPYESFNVRREHVRLENGQREMRLKAAFSFNLKKGEELVVKSSVSEQSADAAYAMVEGHRPAQSFFDERKFRPDDDRMLASNQSPSRISAVASNASSGRSSVASGARPSSSRPTKPVRATCPGSQQRGTLSDAWSDRIVVETREASLRVAFYAALDHLLQLPQMKRVSNVGDLIDRVTHMALTAGKDSLTTAETDTQLRSYAAGCMSGESMKRDADGCQAAWFVLHSIGFHPVTASQGEAQQTTDGTTAMAYELVRPLFNVVTFYYPADRRFIFHTKSNSPVNNRLLKATWNGQPLTTPVRVTRNQLLRGGVLAVKMGK